MISAAPFIIAIVLGYYLWREPWGRGHIVIIALVAAGVIGAVVYWNWPRQVPAWKVEQERRISEFCAERKAQGSLDATVCR